MKRCMLLAVILLAVTGCSDFYSTLGGGGTTGTTGTGFRLLSSNPSDGLTNVSPSINMEFKFTHPLQQSTINPNFVVKEVASGTILTANITYTAGEMNFHATVPGMAPGKEYSVSISEGLMNMDNIKLSPTVYFTFWTGTGGGDTTPPDPPEPTFVISSNAGVIIRWTDPPDTAGDLDHILVKVGANEYSFAKGIQQCHLTDSAFLSAPTTVILQAFDNSGNGSGTASVTAIARQASDNMTIDACGSLTAQYFSYMHPINAFPRGTDNLGTGTLLRPYMIGISEVNYQLWYTVLNWAQSQGYQFEGKGKEANQSGLGTPPSGSTAYTMPVVQVDWRTTVVWCNALTAYYNDHASATLSYVYTSNGVNPITSVFSIGTIGDIQYRPDASGFRLPEPPEWEAAARYVGTTDPGWGPLNYNGLYWTPGSHASGCAYDYTYPTMTANYAWFGGLNVTNSGLKGNNQMGMADMSGNVKETCYVPGASSQQVFGGGAGDSDASFVRVGWYHGTPVSGSTDTNTGLRIARTAYYWRLNP